MITISLHKSPSEEEGESCKPVRVNIFDELSTFASPEEVARIAETEAVTLESALFNALLWATYRRLVKYFLKRLGEKH